MLLLTFCAVDAGVSAQPATEALMLPATDANVMTNRTFRLVVLKAARCHKGDGCLDGHQLSLITLGRAG